MKGHVHGRPSKPDSHTMFCGNHVAMHRQTQIAATDFCIFEIQVTLGVLLILEEFSCCGIGHPNLGKKTVCSWAGSIINIYGNTGSCRTTFA